MNTILVYDKRATDFHSLEDGETPTVNQTFWNINRSTVTDLASRNKSSSFGHLNLSNELDATILGPKLTTEASITVNGRENITVLSRSPEYAKIFETFCTGVENIFDCVDESNISSTMGLLRKNNVGNISHTQTNQNESKLFFTSSDTTEIPSNSTENGQKIRIWDKGLLKRKLLNCILIYFRKAIIVPVSFSLIAVALTVAVFKNRNFRYHAKPIVISFNIFEGLKCVAYLLFRTMKLYTGDARITWNSTYSQFFVYYVIWVPEGLGRIGILHNGLITLDRFFTIAFPIRRLNKRLVTRPKTCVAVIVVSMFLYQSAPLIMYFSYVEPRIDYEKTFSVDEIISEIYVTHPAAYKTYSLVLTIGHACFVYVPLISAIVFNILTIVSLWRHQKIRAALAERPSYPAIGALARNHFAKRQINKMIVGSSLVFAILVLFRRVLPLVSFFIPHFGEGRREMHLYILLLDIFNFLDSLSPVANIISYTILSSQFRRRLKQILFPRSCAGKYTTRPNLSDNMIFTVSAPDQCSALFEI